MTYLATLDPLCLAGPPAISPGLVLQGSTQEAWSGGKETGVSGREERPCGVEEREGSFPVPGTPVA